VIAAEPNLLLSPMSVSDPQYPRQWNLHAVGAEEAWNLTFGDPPVAVSSLASAARVAVLDSGVLSAHPELAPNLLPGVDFIFDPDDAGDGDGLDFDPEEVVDGDMPPAMLLHGTHVAGVIAAATDDGLGVASVSHGASIMPLRVTGMQGASLFAVVNALRYAAGLANASGTVPDQPADVIYIGVGLDVPSNVLRKTLRQAFEQGCVLVAPAGNDSASRKVHPAADRRVIAVAAVTATMDAAEYSNRGDWIDLAAPGGSWLDLNRNGLADEGILSLGGLAGPLSFKAGTSLAAAHVAGAAALLKALDPTLPPAQVRSILEGTARDLGAPGRDPVFGHGLLDVRAAVAALTGGGAGSGFDAHPRFLSFGPVFPGNPTPSWRSATCFGGASGRVAAGLAVLSAPPWIEATLDGDVTPATLTLGANAQSLFVPGVVPGEVVIGSDSGTATIQVELEVRSNFTGPDLGPVTVVLMDRSGESEGRMTTATAAAGYAFSFSGLPPSSYLLIGGTHFGAQDDPFGGPGELFGIYPPFPEGSLFLLPDEIRNVLLPLNSSSVPPPDDP
jgi:serine protease